MDEERGAMFTEERQSAIEKCLRENGKVKVSNTGVVNTDYKFLVSWSEVGNIIFDDSGTSGFTNLKLNGVSSDFILSDKQTPILGTVTFN